MSDDNLGQPPVSLIRLITDLPRYEQLFVLTIVPDIPSGDAVYPVAGRRDWARVPNL